MQSLNLYCIYCNLFNVHEAWTVYFAIGKSQFEDFDFEVSKTLHSVVCSRNPPGWTPTAPAPGAWTRCLGPVGRLWHLAFRKTSHSGSQELLAFTRDLDTELVKARLDLACSLVQFDALFLSPLFRWERMCQVKEECYNTVQAIKKKAAEALTCTCWHNSGPETLTHSVLPFMSSILLWPLVQDLEYFRTTELAKAKADFKREVRWSCSGFWGLWSPEHALTCLHQKRFVLLTMWQVEEVQRQRDMLRKEVEVCRIAVSTFCEFWHLILIDWVG